MKRPIINPNSEQKSAQKNNTQPVRPKRSILSGKASMHKNKYKTAHNFIMLRNMKVKIGIHGTKRGPAQATFVPQEYNIIRMST
jgi:hypothetical protein